MVKFISHLDCSVNIYYVMIYIYDDNKNELPTIYRNNNENINDNKNRHETIKYAT